MKYILASQSPRRRELLGRLGLTFDIMPSGDPEVISQTEPAAIVRELSLHKAQDVMNRLCAQAGLIGAADSVPFDMPDGSPAAAPAGMPVGLQAAAPDGVSVGLNTAAQASAASEPFTVIGADTIVVLDGTVLGKPADREDASRMLHLLSGRTHQVYTGVCLLTAGAQPGRILFHECTDVSVWELTDEEIARYIDSGEPMDKAGAYGIQGAFGAFVRSIHGDYFNVVGLPLARLYHEMRDAGLII